jgi:hypothetical protein
MMPRTAWPRGRSQFHDDGFIPKNYRAWCGFEDRKLYRFAEEISEII